MTILETFQNSVPKEFTATLIHVLCSNFTEVAETMRFCWQKIFAKCVFFRRRALKSLQGSVLRDFTSLCNTRDMFFAAVHSFAICSQIGVTMTLLTVASEGIWKWGDNWQGPKGPAGGPKGRRGDGVLREGAASPLPIS